MRREACVEQSGPEGGGDQSYHTAVRGRGVSAFMIVVQGLVQEGGSGRWYAWNARRREWLVGGGLQGATGVCEVAVARGWARLLGACERRCDPAAS